MGVPGRFLVALSLLAGGVDAVAFLTLDHVFVANQTGNGVLLGVGLNQLLVSKLEMARLPLEYLAGGAVLLWALGVLAVYGPAWRAASISPALATRSS